MKASRRRVVVAENLVNTAAVRCPVDSKNNYGGVDPVHVFKNCTGSTPPQSEMAVHVQSVQATTAATAAQNCRDGRGRGIACCVRSLSMYDSLSYSVPWVGHW